MSPILDEDFFENTKICLKSICPSSVTKSERTVVIFENLPEHLSKISERFILNYRVVETGSECLKRLFFVYSTESAKLVLNFC